MCKSLGLAISDRQHHFHMLWFGSVGVQCMFFTDGDGQYNDTYDRYRQCIISGKIDSGRWIRLPRCRFVLLRFRSHEMTFPPRSNECHSWYGQLVFHYTKVRAKDGSAWDISHVWEPRFWGVFGQLDSSQQAFRWSELHAEISMMRELFHMFLQVDASASESGSDGSSTRWVDEPAITRYPVRASSLLGRTGSLHPRSPRLLERGA